MLIDRNVRVTFHAPDSVRYFSDEAETKGRKDNVAYGVNTANIYKRLGLQIAEKGALLRQMGSKLYVVSQRRTFDYLMTRIDVEWTEGADWDITFLTFDYTGTVLENGQLEFKAAGIFRTTVAQYAKGLVTPTAKVETAEFLKRVRKKAGLT